MRTGRETQTHDRQRPTSVSTTIPPTSYPSDPVEFAIHYLNFIPDPVQASLLASTSRRILVNCCRQWGKSSVSAAKATHHALTVPESLTIVASPSAHQSAELVRKIERNLTRLGIPFKGDGDNKCSIILPNGSRII